MMPSSLLLRPCRTDDELHAWVRLFIGLDVPRVPACAGHDAPFDYLRHSYFEPASDLVVWAPRGGGKTRLAAVATLLDLLHKPPLSVRILGGSLEQSMKLWDYLLPDLDRLARSLLVRKLHDSVRRVKLTTGANAAVLAQSQRAVRGLRVQKLRCDEIELFDPKIWEAAQLTTRSIKARRVAPARQRRAATRPRAGAITEDAAPGPRCDPDLAECGPAVEATRMIAGAVEALSTLHASHGLMSRVVEQARSAGTRVLRWCLLDVLERCPPGRDCATCPLFDDCRGRAKTACHGFVSIDDAIRMKSRVSHETWQCEMLCRRPSTRGRVFPSFDEQTHVRAWDGEFESISLAVDFGFAAPFVALWIARSGDGATHVFDEHVQAERTIDQHLAEIAARPWPRASRVFCDPAGAGRSAQTAASDVQLLRGAGYLVRYRQSRVTDGIEQIRHALRPATGEPRLLIDPRCTKLIAALRSYRYPETGGEAPLKDGTHDHPIDALRYYFVNAEACGPVRVRRY